MVLHKQLEAAAQRYVLEPDAIGSTQASVQNDIAAYRGSGGEEQGTREAYDALEVVRTEREPQFAAVSRLIGDEVVHRLLEHSDEHGLDAAALNLGESSGAYDTLLNGVSRLFDEAADHVTATLKAGDHVYNPLYRLLGETHQRFLDAAQAAAGNEKKAGTQLTRSDSIDTALRDGFSNNYREFGASLLVMYGIAMQPEPDVLPTATELSVASTEERPHWLALLAQSRQAFFGKQFFGPTYYGRILQELQDTGVFPDWVTSWSTGLDKATKGENDPFAGCSTEAPLLYRRPRDSVPLVWKSPKRCAGQIAVRSLYPADNTAAVELSRRIGGGIESSGRFSPGEILVDVGRAVAGRTLFEDEVCRGALIAAKRYCDSEE